MIRSAKKEELAVCLDLAKNLSDFFSKDGIREMEKDLENTSVFIYDGGSIKGFVALKEKSKDVAEIAWIAVANEYQREGIGKDLLCYVEESTNYKILLVKTLDEKADYQPYDAARKFYEKNGFLKIDVIDPYPGWGKENPCAIYVKPVAPR